MTPPTHPSATWAESPIDTQAPGRLAFDLYDAIHATDFPTFASKVEALGGSIIPGAHSARWPSIPALREALAKD